MALAAMYELLASYFAGGQIEILLKCRPSSVETVGDRVQAVRLRDDNAGDEITVVAPYVLDATELGDLLPLAGVKHVTGADGQSQTAEPHALASDPDPLDQQAITACFAIDSLVGDLRAWALYDAANSAFVTSVIATIFPIYFQTVAAADLEPASASALAPENLAVAVSAMLSPPLGAMADYAAVRKRLLGLFLAFGTTATACMYFIERGDWTLALWLFAAGNIGVSVRFVFYDSLLPHIARPHARSIVLRRYRSALLMLLAFLVYNDGITTIVRMAAIYGAELGFPQGDLIAAILIVQFVGIPFAFLFGAAAARMAGRRAIFVGLGVYFADTLLAYCMASVAHFYLLAALVGMVQGGTQALSWPLFASLTPRTRPQSSSAPTACSIASAASAE